MPRRKSDRLFANVEVSNQRGLALGPISCFGLFPEGKCSRRDDGIPGLAANRRKTGFVRKRHLDVIVFAIGSEALSH